MESNRKSITLFQFWGHGDSMNISWAPRLIKQRISKDIFVRVLVKKSHEVYFSTNPFVDEVVVVSDDVAQKYRKSYVVGMFENELNMWCGAGKSDYECRSFMSWDIPYESAKLLNKWFQQEVVKYTDSLLPELWYTEIDRESVKDFIQTKSPYIIVETENFSGQYSLPAEKMIDMLYGGISKDKTGIIYTSFMGTGEIPIGNLKQFNLKQVGLLIESSIAFYGLSSGMSAVSYEITLREPKRRVISAPNNAWVDRFIRNKKTADNTSIIHNKDYLSYVITDISRGQYG